MAQPSMSTFATRAALMQAAAEAIALALATGIAEHGRACAALSGGATPEPAYAALARMPLDWSKITFALVDERYVPPDHAASNESMVRRALAPALAQGARLAPMYAPGGAQSAAAAADAAYRTLTFDIAVMGLGEDGHTASWFPGADALAHALDPQTQECVMALAAPQATGASQRLTLTRAALSRARTLLLLITGDPKRAALNAAMAAGSDAPAAALFAPEMPPLRILWAP